MLRFGLHAFCVGLWVGAAAGAATALSDFGAHWLFMESGADRAQLLLRVLTTQMPVGAFAGAALGLCFALVERALGVSLRDSPAFASSRAHAP